MQPTITHGSLKLLLTLTWRGHAVHPVVSLSASLTLVVFNETSCSQEHLVWPAGRFGSFAHLWLSWDLLYQRRWAVLEFEWLTTWSFVQDCWTALISAAKEGHIEVVRELLENHANLEHRDLVRRWKHFSVWMIFGDLFCVVEISQINISVI